MGLLDSIHTKHVFRRRVRVLSRMFAEMLPANASVLDVGCGEGSIDSLIMALRPDVSIRGADLLVRSHTHIPVDLLDSKTLPYDDESVDVVLLVDVLHHSEDPIGLLSEVARVTRRRILLKDHLCEGPWDRYVLKTMDWVGNARHGVPLLSNYWARRQWEDAFTRLSLVPVQWSEKLGLYPRPAGWIFDRSLHFLAEIEKRK
jgi:SAM-dependent methyltransferase